MAGTGGSGGGTTRAAGAAAGGASGSVASAGAGGTSPGAAGSGGQQSGTGGAAGVGVGGAGGAAGGAAPPGPTECDGKPLPERARAAATPPAGAAAVGLEPYFPTGGFRSADAEMLGFDPTELQRAIDYDTPQSSTQAILVVRYGYLAAEKYVGSFGAGSTHESFSMAKSFASALVGIAIEAGLIAGTDELLCMYYPDDWDCSDSDDPRSRITIEHAMNLTTGLQWNEDWRTTASGGNDAFNFNLLSTVLSRPAVTEPGSMVRYSTGDPALLTGVLQEATGMTAFAYAQDVLLGPIGASSVRWNSDTSGRTTTYAGLQATAVDYAKFGYLYMNGGLWDGEQIVPADWIAKTTRAEDPCADWYRYLWHINPPVRLGEQDPSCPTMFCPPTAFANLPADAFFAEGVNGQFVFVVPSSDLVVVRLANDSPGIEYWDTYASEFLGMVLDAIE
jgi:CubicO group peptidase (beta-lactamase class C family)